MIFFSDDEALTQEQMDEINDYLVKKLGKDDMPEPLSDKMLEIARGLAKSHPEMCHGELIDEIERLRKEEKRLRLLAAQREVALVARSDECQALREECDRMDELLRKAQIDD